MLKLLMDEKKRCPAAEPRDYCKLLYQSEFGAGHMAADGATDDGIEAAEQADDPAGDKAREQGLGHERPGALTAQGRGFQDEGRQRRAESHGYPVGMRGADRANKKRCACNSLKI